ncbi:DJ-1/PfpI family protein [Phenylobacterium sp. 58.2.17]|uniref:DJ-1/PfpI family protein n=1 Tax=Phenylobacterium sp. 58.2.17 TaxID=2969306 RepID=UPI0022643112|nr:DJ-1/PfpI family protein [Phenylobacterium sp. 58.2.17]MCX7587757.1 DJ-1/PfpI family protein [Phenylobacterium sp. 58.2.17]
MRMSILLYDGFTALDIVGGYESLSRIPGMQVEFVAKEKGVIASDTRFLGLLAYKTLEDAAGTDILYVPGGPGGYVAQRDPEILDFIRAAHATSTWTVGVCNGVEVLAAAGVLDGVEVTTNFFARDQVAALGAKVMKTRYHRDGKVVTGAGVSASADAGLMLTEILVGQPLAEIIQLGIEYYPSPPFGAATVDETRPELQDAIRSFEERAEALLEATPRVF